MDAAKAACPDVWAYSNVTDVGVALSVSQTFERGDSSIISRSIQALMQDRSVKCEISSESESELENKTLLIVL